jgi:hypothetical protein
MKKYKKIKIDRIAKKLGKEIATFYDKVLLDNLSSSLSYDFGKIIGYKNIRVPVYFKIYIPVVEKHYDTDSEYGSGEFEGWLISFREIKLFKIWNKIEKQPIYRKEKGKTVSFTRYKEL